MRDMKKSKSLYSLRKKAGRDEEETPLLPGASASTASLARTGSGAGKLLRTMRSVIGAQKTNADVPPVPGLPENLGKYADSVPGAGSRDRVPQTPPPTPTSEKGKGPDGRLNDPWKEHRDQNVGSRLERRLKAKVESRAAKEIAQAFAGDRPRTPEYQPKEAAHHTHTPRAPGTWKAPGTENDRTLSVREVERRLPAKREAKPVVGEDRPNVQGVLVGSRKGLDKQGREAMPKGNKGREKLAKIDKGKGRDPGPSQD